MEKLSLIRPVTIPRIDRRIERQSDATIKQMLDELKTEPFVKARKPTVPQDLRRGVVNAFEK